MKKTRFIWLEKKTKNEWDSCFCENCQIAQKKNPGVFVYFGGEKCLHAVGLSSTDRNNVGSKKGLKQVAKGHVN